MNTGLFVISQYGKNDPSDYSYYSKHGSFRGVENVITYSDVAGAMKFFTREAAQSYIDTELPEYAQHNNSVVELSRNIIFLFAPDDYIRLIKWEQNRSVVKVTLRINPDDSEGAGIIKFYDRLASICGLDPDKTGYDCTKIHVSKNIQSNIFAVLDAESSDPCHTGKMWCLRGPKTFDELPDDTVELLDGFFRKQDESPIPFGVAIKNYREAA